MSLLTQSINAVIADVTEHPVQAFRHPPGFTYLLTNGSPVVISDPVPLMQELEKELNGCIRALPLLTWPSDGVAQFSEEVQDLDAVLFLFGELKRYCGLMASLAEHFSGKDWTEMGSSESEQVILSTVDAYARALDLFLNQQEVL